MTGFDPKVFRKIARDRGYISDAILEQTVSKLIGVKTIAMVRDRLHGRQSISFAESFVLASFFRMTPKEYADTFISGIFVEDREGHFVAHIADPAEVLNEKSRWQQGVRERKRRREEEREALAREAEEF